MKILTTQARAKINLCLFVGPLRPDGLHEVVTLMDSLELCDDVRLVIDENLATDEVVCPGVQGPNLAAAALAGSLALAPGAPRDIRERTRAALAELGHRQDVRAERLSPQDFRLLHAKLSG